MIEPGSINPMGDRLRAANSRAGSSGAASTGGDLDGDPVIAALSRSKTVFNSMGAPAGSSNGPETNAKSESSSGTLRGFIVDMYRSATSHAPSAEQLADLTGRVRKRAAALPASAMIGDFLATSTVTAASKFGARIAFGSMGVSGFWLSAGLGMVGGGVRAVWKEADKATFEKDTESAHAIQRYLNDKYRGLSASSGRDLAIAGVRGAAFGAVGGVVGAEVSEYVMQLEPVKEVLDKVHQVVSDTWNAAKEHLPDASKLFTIKAGVPVNTQGTPLATASITGTPESTPTPKATFTPSSTATLHPTETPTAKPTFTPSVTATPNVTETPTVTATVTSSPTAIATATPTIENLQGLTDNITKGLNSDLVKTFSGNATDAYVGTPATSSIINEAISQVDPTHTRPDVAKAVQKAMQEAIKQKYNDSYLADGISGRTADPNVLMPKALGDLDRWFGTEEGKTALKEAAKKAASEKYAEAVSAAATVTPSATSSPTAIPATATPQPTEAPIPATATPEPTATVPPATATTTPTQAVPTPTHTAVPATATPTNTAIPAAATADPTVAPPTPSPTLSPTAVPASPTPMPTLAPTETPMPTAIPPTPPPATATPFVPRGADIPPIVTKPDLGPGIPKGGSLGIDIPSGLSEEMNIKAGDSVSGILVNSGFNVNWGPGDADLWGAHIALNYPMLTEFWDKMDVNGYVPEGVHFPIKMEDLSSVVEQAKNGSPEVQAQALAKLKLALRFIPAGGKFKVLQDHSAGALMKLVAGRVAVGVGK